MGADEFIRARIGETLKQEFQDICPNMSQCLIALIDDYVVIQKEKYTSTIITFLKKDSAGIDNVLALGQLIERICTVIKRGADSPQELIKVLRQEFNYTLDELVILIYRDLLRGLYAGKNKEDIHDASERLYRNKDRIMTYIQNRLLESE